MQPLSKPQYQNGMILAPDGQALCRVSDKRLNWYLDRNLATKESEDPLVIRLKFEPSGRSLADPLLLLPRKNICVVCGSNQELTRHHVVPRCYRRHFPDKVKSNSSYDVVPICIDCHLKYESFVGKAREVLAQQYDVPTKMYHSESDKQLKHASSAAWTLRKHGEKIPPEKQLLLKERVAEYLGVAVDMLTEQDYQRLISQYRGTEKGMGYLHAKLVMEKVKDLNEFVSFWRRHFFDTMKPAFAPEYLDINRQVI